MIASHATESDLYRALSLVNRFYDGNLRFRSLSREGRRVRFTLGIVASRVTLPVSRQRRDGTLYTSYVRTPAPGVRRSPSSSRLIAAACWHAHGHFFEALLALVPAAVVRSSWSGGPCTISASGGNWHDGNIGSRMQPCAFSSACDCDPYSRDSISAGILEHARDFAEVAS